MNKSGYLLLQALRKQEEIVLYNTAKKYMQRNSKISSPIVYMRDIIRVLVDKGIISSYERAHYILKKWISRGIYQNSVTLETGWFTNDTDEKIKNPIINIVNKSQLVSMMDILQLNDLIVIMKDLNINDITTFKSTVKRRLKYEIYNIDKSLPTPLNVAYPYYNKQVDLEKAQRDLLNMSLAQTAKLITVMLGEEDDNEEIDVNDILDTTDPNDMRL